MGKLAKFFADSAAARNAFDAMALGFSIFYLIFITVVVAKSALDRSFLMLTPDYLFFCFLCLMHIVSKGRKGMVADFLPPIILLFSYDAMRGFVDNWAGHVEFNFPIAADKFIGGGALPTTILQHAVDGSGFVAIAEIVSTSVYVLHFTAPILFGFVIWLGSRQQYYRFMAALIILTYLALVTFWLFPVAPPWMAAQNGMIDAKQKFDDISAKYDLFFLPGLYLFVNANPVAAIPSLHFAYPFLALIYAIVSRRKLAVLFFAGYALLVGLATIYLGEHYVVDLIIGAVYAVVAMVIADWVSKRYFANLTQ